MSPSAAVFFLAWEHLFIWHGFKVSLVCEADCDFEFPLVGHFCLFQISMKLISLLWLPPVIESMIEVDLLLHLSSEYFPFIAVLVLLVA